MIVGRIYLGTETAGDGHAISYVERVRRLSEIRKGLLDGFGGFTQYDSIGWWHDTERNHNHKEVGIVFEVLTTGDKKARLQKIAKEAGKLLEQSAVIVTFQPIESTLIDCEK